jgi:hypothetical protein
VFFEVHTNPIVSTGWCCFLGSQAPALTSS